MDASCAAQVSNIVKSAERLLADALTVLPTDPAKAAHQIQAAIGTLHSTKGFLL